MNENIFCKKDTIQAIRNYSFINHVKKKSARFAGTFSLRASLASLSAPRARDSIVALRAPEFLNVALRARSCALRIRLSLFLII